MVMFKNRYLLMEILWLGDPGPNPATLTHGVVRSAIQESIALNFGEHGLSSSLPSLQVKYLNSVTGLCLLRCARQEFQKVWCAITFMTNIQKLPMIFNLLDLSGNPKISRRTIVKFDDKKLRLLELQMKRKFTKEELVLSNRTTSRAHAMEG